MAQGRIVLDARTLRGKAGGVATYVEALVQHLPACLPNVQFIFLRHPDLKKKLSDAPNVTEWSLGWPANSLWTYFRMGRWLNARLTANDLFHAPQRIIPKNLNIKSVVTVHDLMQIVCPEQVFPSVFERVFVTPYWSSAMRNAIRRANRLVAVSQHTADETVRLDPSAAERVRVVRHGKSESFRPIEKREAERLTDALIPSERRFFLVLGGGYPNKNHTAAVAGFARATVDLPADIDLLVVQRQRTFPVELRKLLRQSGIRDRVHVLRSVTNEQLVALYNRAEALVFPSRYEGFGLPVLEAMACGCPVICSDATSLPEVAGDAALFVKPNDDAEIAGAMQRLVKDKTLKSSLSERGLRQAARFDWKKTAAETVSVYREIMPWIPAPNQA
jgi:alpha-1,3-rhamnosyl/mannosyltransferase